MRFVVALLILVAVSGCVEPPRSHGCVAEMRAFAATVPGLWPRMDTNLTPMQSYEHRFPEGMRIDSRIVPANWTGAALTQVVWSPDAPTVGDGRVDLSNPKFSLDGDGKTLTLRAFTADHVDERTREALRTVLSSLEGATPAQIEAWIAAFDAQQGTDPAEVELPPDLRLDPSLGGQKWELVQGGAGGRQVFLGRGNYELWFQLPTRSSVLDLGHLGSRVWVDPTDKAFVEVVAAPVTPEGVLWRVFNMTKAILDPDHIGHWQPRFINVSNVDPFSEPCRW